MFLDDSVFDVEEERKTNTNNSNYYKHTTTSQSLDLSSTGRYGGRSSIGSSTTLNKATINDINRGNDADDDNDDDGPLGVAESSNSRARMLAQQREIQLKKRQSAVQNNGMMRMSLDKPPTRGSVHTPAVRQFSAPKKSRDNEIAEDQSEFNRSKPSNNDDYDRENYSRDNLSSTYPRRSVTTSRMNIRDSSDDDYDMNDRRESNNGRRNNRNEDEYSNGRYNRMDDDYNDRRSKRDQNDGGRDSQSEDFDYDQVYSRNRNTTRKADSNSNGSNTGMTSRSSINSGMGGNNGTTKQRGNKEETIEWDRDRTEPSRSRQTGFDSRDDQIFPPEGSKNRWESNNSNNNPPSNNNNNYNNRRGGDERPMRETIPASIPEQPSTPTPLNLSNMKAFLTSPVPRSAGVVQCYIRRIKGVSSMFPPVYNLYLKDGDRFLLTSKKRPNNKTSNYLISMAENDLNRESGNYLGKLRSNFVGTEFQVYDNGVSPKDAGTAGESAVRKELASVMYAANLLGSRGPRKMQVCIPTVDENDRMVTWRDGPDREDILTRMKERNYRDLVYMINKPPRWNEVVGAYVLNFNGRVTMASVKNFQLVSPDEQNTVILQFGKVAKEEFSMDLQWPCSPLQAFAITLSSFDSKIACD